MTSSHHAQDEHGLHTDRFQQLEDRIALLGLAGFPHNYHTLHQILIYQRKIVRVQDFGLHLVWKEQPALQFIKPLAAGLFTPDAKLVSPWAELSVLERSWLYTFHRLIESELDFDIAIDEQTTLLPAVFSEDSKSGYTKWKEVVSGFPQTLQDADWKSLKRGTRDVQSRITEVFQGGQIHQRFWYGDLRLSRLNLILSVIWFTRSLKRLIAAVLVVCLPPVSILIHKDFNGLDLSRNIVLTCLGILPGSVHAVYWHRKHPTATKREHRQRSFRHSYFYHTRDPVSTFWTGFGKYIIIAFAYLTTALAAMQVALAAPEGDGQRGASWFGYACKVFSYISLVLIAIQIPTVLLYGCVVSAITIGGWLRRKDSVPAPRGGGITSDALPFRFFMFVAMRLEWLDAGNLGSPGKRFFTSFLTYWEFIFKVLILVAMLDRSPLDDNDNEGHQNQFPYHSSS